MNLIYFARIRENIGLSSQTLTLPDNVTTAGALLTHLETLGDNYRAAFADSDLIRIAVNQEYVGLDHAVSDSDEVAIFPPMTGG